MTAEERDLRAELQRLVETERGRALLQLSLRGIHRGDQGLTAGCWRDRGVAGCLFQHAYWQGVREGVFRDEGRPGDWIGSFMGRAGYGVVVDGIRAFDRLAKRHHADVHHRLLLPDRIDVRVGEWRDVVERMLVEALAETGTPGPQRNRVVAQTVEGTNPL
jgi:hypothetical protein